MSEDRRIRLWLQCALPTQGNIISRESFVLRVCGEMAGTNPTVTGKLPISRLPPTQITKKGRQKMTEEEKQAKKREEDKVRNKTRINIGVAFERWRKLRLSKGFKTDAKLATFLLDQESLYIKEEPVVSSSNEVELDNMASLSDQSSELEQEVKTEPASCEDVSENKENKDEDDGDISASLSVGDGYYLVDLGSSSEFVVDEECILELFRSCQRCSRHCRVMKRVQGLKIVVNQKCCYCDNRFEWTNLPDGFADEDDRDLHITDRRQLTAA
ncbi:uncharacterized protein V3H82_027528 isoform 4-T4 [Fundulus diaphanus]